MRLAEPIPPRPEPEDQFDRFLFEHFAALRRELDAQVARHQPREGVWKELPRQSRRPTKGGWLTGIAALLLLAASVPLVIQLNQKQAEQKAAPISTTTSDDTSGLEEPHSADSATVADTAEKEDRRSTKKSGQAAAPANTRAISEPATRTVERAAVTAKEEPPAVLAPLPPSPSTRAPAPSKQNEAVTPAAEAEQPEIQIKSRSAPVSDGQFRLKQSELATIEKAEMEKLWSEYEKNPQEFLKDKLKTHRLKLLLSRYDTQGRAKRLEQK